MQTLNLDFIVGVIAAVLLIGVAGLLWRIRTSRRTMSDAGTVVLGIGIGPNTTTVNIPDTLQRGTEVFPTLPGPLGEIPDLYDSSFDNQYDHAKKKPTRRVKPTTKKPVRKTSKKTATTMKKTNAS